MSHLNRPWNYIPFKVIIMCWTYDQAFRKKKEIKDFIISASGQIRENIRRTVKCRISWIQNSKLFLQLHKTLHLKYPNAKKYIFVRPFQLLKELCPEQEAITKKIKGVFDGRAFKSFSTDFTVTKASSIFSDSITYPFYCRICSSMTIYTCKMALLICIWIIISRYEHRASREITQ